MFERCLLHPMQFVSDQRAHAINDASQNGPFLPLLKEVSVNRMIFGHHLTDLLGDELV